MKKCIFLLSWLACSSWVLNAHAADPSLKTDGDKISYSIGVDIGKHFRQQDVKINSASFLKGVEHGQQQKQLLMTEKEIKETLLSLQEKILTKENENREKLAKTNMEKGKEFLTKNKQKKDIKVTGSGLQYKVIEAGQGNAPLATDRVITHYRGTLIDGTEFDSSYSRGEPAEFTVNSVIPGWTEALQMMKPGAKWELYIPPDLAYGEHGVGNVIGPNSTLIFEIELLEVHKVAKN